MPKHPRKRPTDKPPEPRPRPAGDEDEGPIAGLNRAAQAVHEGRTPQSVDLALCRQERWQHGMDLRCWNGHRRDRPDCGYAGSQNIPYLAEAGLRNWPWIAANCRLEREEGMFGREIGAPSSFYYSAILRCKATAWRELQKAGDAEGAEACRLAIRSALAWDALVALPVSRTVDRINAAGVVHEVPDQGQRTPVLVAAAGNRYTVRTERQGRPTEIAHSVTLAAVLDNPLAYGLTWDEQAVLERAVLDGDTKDARELSTWMFGAYHSPDVSWRFRLRRTTEGTETVYFGPWPSPYKPPRSVTQVTWDGSMTGMKPSPYKVGNWKPNGYAVTIDAGVIHAKCDSGEAEIAELGGARLWTVEVNGPSVEFI